MELPRITIVTPSYNQGQYLGSTIRSVLDQGYPNLEYIVVDGGSTDDSVEVIRRHQEKLAWWVSEKDRGQSHALNKGFARATGDLHAYINSDDTLAPGSLMAAAEAYRAGHEWVTGWVILLDGVGEWPQVPMGRECDMEWITANPICQQATYWSARLAKKLGPFREELHYTMDYDYWLRLWFVARVRPHMLHRCMGGYRLHDTSKTVAQAAAFEPEWARLRTEFGKYLTPAEQRQVDEHFEELARKDHQRRAWASLKDHDVSTARAHAREVLRRDRFSVSSWKLMYCALRGR